MSIYDSILSKPELKMLRKHSHSLQDEIELLQVTIRHGVESKTLGLDDLCQAAESIARLKLAQRKLESKGDDELQRAFLQALKDVDAEDAGQPASTAPVAAPQLALPEEPK